MRQATNRVPASVPALPTKKKGTSEGWGPDFKAERDEFVSHFVAQSGEDWWELSPEEFVRRMLEPSADSHPGNP